MTSNTVTPKQAQQILAAAKEAGKMWKNQDAEVKEDTEVHIEANVNPLNGTRNSWLPPQVCFSPTESALNDAFENK